MSIPAEVSGVLVAVTAVNDGDDLPAFGVHGGENGGQFLGMGEADGVFNDGE